MEPFSSNVSLWNQFKYIVLSIFSCRILIISNKILIITGISNEKTNELNIYAIYYVETSQYFADKN